MPTSIKYKLVQQKIKNNKCRNWNSILEKEQGMKKIMAKDNKELKTQNQALQRKMRENQEKHEENLKILCKAKEELQNLNKEQIQQVKRLIEEKDQQTQIILNVKSTNNELEQQMKSLKRVKEKSQIRRKPESSRSIKDHTNQKLYLNDNNLSNFKQFQPVPRNKEKLCHVCGSENHETV